MIDKDEITVTMSLAEFEALKKQGELDKESSFRRDLDYFNQTVSVRNKDFRKFNEGLPEHMRQSCDLVDLLIVHVSVDPSFYGQHRVDIDLDVIIEFIKKYTGINEVRLIHNGE